MIFIIKGFRTIVFIFIVIYTTFLPICPPAFFRYLSNSGTYTELQTTSFIESTQFACSDSVCHNRMQVFLYCYSAAVRIEPATARRLSLRSECVCLWATEYSGRCCWLLISDPVLVSSYSILICWASSCQRKLQRKNKEVEERKYLSNFNYISFWYVHGCSVARKCLPGLFENRRFSKSSVEID